ncbi:biotin--[acetyl-CoA-carboxylase] ligase [Altererythrobacter lutimaris]|uniref:biotin--[biotin carboxyl-carrier protein] ligase n=1 Tax=Altererythrobacter lutimaris TaxID=2743979 RepID=A0A850H848_9SPHN|nr:biotin--[acetyl-CoA-carboxylase] ligase [Altererythrobacter lutimaris]NVE93959.1 biotin--[acetyl-CoA-carboxylase] ligase [Altererythrobacter lutimaris]
MIQVVAETGSTNADLIARLNEGERVAEGHWLIADRQTSGRGRQGRDWFDGSGNFMGSTVIHLTPQDPAPHTLSLAVGLAVYEAVRPFGPAAASLMLKWPNDLLLNGGKLCGILLERVNDTIVAGVGVNLNSAPELPNRETIALSKFGPAPDRDIFASSLAKALDTELERWRTYGLPALIRRWEAVGTPRGTLLSVHEPDGSLIEGQFAGLDVEGTLQLRLEDGSTRAIHAGDVFLV